MSYDALRSILPVAGWAAGTESAVEFVGGGDPILPTPFRIGAAGAATLAATGLAAAGCGSCGPGAVSRSRLTFARPLHRCAAVTT